MPLNTIFQIQRKELILFFVSPIGYLFLAAFLAVTLFVVFWGESYFARNIADVRPMFEWMPILLIFLSAALTMRMWSEERRSGTLEFVATMPASTWSFVLGKFLACWCLLAIALLLTLPLPVTVSVIGDLDWGPVFAGYLAAMLLGGAYIAIGLYISSRTDSQIVALMLASLVSGVFYLIGSPVITELFGSGVQAWLAAIGSGARFESITRGVLDVRDLYYYACIALVFLTLNVFALERERWSAQGDSSRHRFWRISTALVVANLLLANLWLQNVSVLRVDVTQGKIYSISDATRGYLAQLQEPLLIRGYFSAKTHPELAPLVPRLKDLLSEYAVAGDSQVRVEFIDPATAPEMENEANSKYGIRAVPFQVADRYQASLVNSYFDILIAYGDEFEVLNFQDLIEVKVAGEGDFEVQLTNPEFDVTRAIKKVLYGFQGGASVFDNLPAAVDFIGYISADEQLPPELQALKASIAQVLEKLAVEADGKLTVEIVDPMANGGEVAQQISEQYGFAPMAASLFDAGRFYFYLTLNDGDTVVQVPIPDGDSEDAIRRGLEEGLKRFATGLLKSVVLVAPEPVPPYMQQQGMPGGNEFNTLRDFLSADFNVLTDDLSEGVVPAQADMVIVVDPTGFTSKQVFALDQFLMKGGTVLVSTGAFAAQPSQSGLFASPRDSGLTSWLAHHGITVGQELVMDRQNSAFPVPVTRQAGGFSFQDLVMLDYPYFIDVRGEGLDDSSPINAGLPQVTLSWTSPLTLEPAENVAATTLLSSSSNSWLSNDTNVMPQIDEQGNSTFTPAAEQKAYPLAAVLQGRFDSYFRGQDSPLLAPEPQEQETDAEPADEVATGEDDLGVVSSVIERSPESARLMVFGSNDFLADQTLRMVGAADGTIYGNSIQMVANAVDWTLEDQNLIGIRARGNFNRTLPGMDVATQSLIEVANYVMAMIGVLLVWFVFHLRSQARRREHGSWMSGVMGDQL
ncbi:MAG: Gldg family protein [bacterium]